MQRLDANGTMSLLQLARLKRLNIVYGAYLISSSKIYFLFINEVSLRLEYGVLYVCYNQ